MRKITIIFVLILSLFGCSTTPDVVVPEPVPLPIPEPTPIPEPKPEPIISISLPLLKHLSKDELLSYKEPYHAPNKEELLKTVNNDQDLDFIIQEAVDYNDLLLYSDNFQELKNNYYFKYELEDVLTKDDALADIEYLVELLIKGYGGLNEVGGAPRVKQILEEANVYFNEHDEIDFIRFKELVSILTRFMIDGHYSVLDSFPPLEMSYLVNHSGWDKFVKEEYSDIRNTTYYADNLQLVRNDNDQLVDSVNSKLVNIDEALIKPVLKNGELFESIVLVNNYKPIEFISEIEYLDGTTKELTYEPIETSFYWEELETKAYDQTYYINLQYGALQNEVYELGEQVSLEINNYPYVIIDLRQNAGGFYTATDVILYEMFPDYFSMFSNTPYYFVEPLEEQVYEMNQTFDLEPNFLSEKQYVFDYRRTDLISNHQLILVLTDNVTGSAGEFLTGILRAAPNAIVIGTQTFGTATSNLGIFYTLPNSELPLRIPSSFYYYNPLEYTMEKGYQPDIYAQIDSVQELIDYLNNLE